MPSALVLGATGVVGRALTRHLAALPEWQVVAVSRRMPEGAVRHLAVDLFDTAACREGFSAATEVSHAFFAAYLDRADAQQLVEHNTQLLANTLDALHLHAPRLRHVHLVEGTKWYGSHLGPFRTPAREDDPRHMPPNFYYAQQDLLEQRQRGQAWTWSASRPHAVCGYSTGSAMNLVTTLGVYAAISRELGLPLVFPGHPDAYTALYQCCEATHLARAAQWMATEPGCANEAFNITNGDVFRWCNLWPRIAAVFDMSAAEPRRLPLSRFMADKSGLWSDMVQRYGLRPHRLDELASWPFADYVWAANYDIISDMNKARRFGFREWVDSEAMWLEQLRQLRAERVLP